MVDEHSSDFRRSFFDDSTSTSYIDSTNLLGDLYDGEHEIRKKLEWYFKTPFDKYKYKGRKPFKFLLQIIKIVIVTVQATLFAVDEFSIVDFNNDSVETFRNVFILDYGDDEIKKLYTKESVYNHMFYAWKQYYNFGYITTGSYVVMKDENFIKPIYFCKDWNTKLHNLFISQVYPMSVGTSDYDDSTKNSQCYDLKPPKLFANKTTIAEFIQQNNLPVRLGWILSMKMSYSFQMNYSVVHEISPDCYKFNVDLYFDNNDLDGIMTVSLNSAVNLHACHKPNGIHIKEYRILESSQTVFDVIVILVCFISTSLCLRSFKAHFKIYKQAETFFRVYRQVKFKFSDKTVFVSFWLVIMVLSDVCALAGSTMKITIDWLQYPELYTSCSLCLGIAVLFSWIGILRYLGFMRGYNTLLVTLKVAFPSIIRFICCVGFIYMGFVICGWIVFGPYHEKFSSLLITSECLYSLLNGDDMFRTFILMNDVSPMIFYFSKFYLYVFNSLFIFVVLSLFIGIVGDTFEKIKKRGYAPKTRVELFMDNEEYDYDE